MKSLIKYILILVVALSGVSCASSMSRKLSIDGYENLEVLGFSGVKCDIIFGNQSGHKIKVLSTSVTLKESGSEIVTLSLKDEIVIPKRSDSASVSTLWRMQDVNMLKAISASKKILSGNDTQNFRLDVTAQVKVSGIKRTVERSDLSFSQLINL